jgi:hypothetical protein
VHLLCAFFFPVRRLLLVAATVMLSDHPAFQVMAFIFLSELNIIYLIQCRPYEDRLMNLNEIFNEGCVMASGYTLLMFTEQVQDIAMREATGYIIIGLILLNFLVNLLIQVI